MKKLEEEANLKEKEKTSQLYKPNIEIKHDSSKMEIKKNGSNMKEESDYIQNKSEEKENKLIQRNSDKHIKEIENHKSINEKSKEKNDIPKGNSEEKFNHSKESSPNSENNLLNAQIFQNIKEENAKVEKRISPIKSETIIKEERNLVVKNSSESKIFNEENKIQDILKDERNAEEQKINNLKLKIEDKKEERKEEKKDENKLAEILANAERNRARKRKENKVGNILDDLLNPKKPSEKNSPPLENLDIAQKMLEDANKKMTKEHPFLELNNISNFLPSENEMKIQEMQNINDVKINDIKRSKLLSDKKSQEIEGKNHAIGKLEEHQKEIIK